MPPLLPRPKALEAYYRALQIAYNRIGTFAVFVVIGWVSTRSLLPSTVLVPLEPALTLADVSVCEGRETHVSIFHRPSLLRLRLATGIVRDLGNYLAANEFGGNGDSQPVKFAPGRNLVGPCLNIPLAVN